MKYFKLSELACRCSCGKTPVAETRAFADRVRHDWTEYLKTHRSHSFNPGTDGPLVCTSGARCYKRVEALREAGYDARLKSAHNEGLALDLTPIAPQDIEEFQQFCMSMLETWDAYMESPEWTPTWCHLQLRKAGRRVFVP